MLSRPRGSCADGGARVAAAQVRYVIGGSFVKVSNDDAETRLQAGARAWCSRLFAPTLVAGLTRARLNPRRAAATEEAGAEVERLSAELESTKKEMARLKGILYAKFGDSINLEE